MKNFHTIKAKQIIISICLLGLIGFANIYAQDWNPLAPHDPPSKRQGHSMITLANGRVLLFGGASQGYFLNDLYEFSSHIGWSAMSPIGSSPPPRRYHQAWRISDKMYIYGGEGENGALDDLWSYNPTANTWHQEEISGPGPAARHGHATTTLTDGSEVIVGGTGADGVALKDCWRLNADNTFTQLQDAPYAYTGHRMELGPNGEWLYVFGKPGSLGIYRVSTDRWSLVSGGPPNGKGCMTSQGNNSAGEPVVFIFGGKDINGNEMNQTWQYNLYGGELTQRGNMPQPIVNGSTATIRATPPAAGLLKGSNLNFLEDFGQTTLVFGGVSNGVVTNNEYLFSAQTPPDTIRTIATADTIRTDYIELFWNIAEPIGASYYEAQILLDTTSNTVFADTVLTDTTVTITGLEPQTNYYWRVRGYNSGGWGASSVILHFYTAFITGIKDNGNEIPKGFKLHQNYPNPFFAKGGPTTTTIKYTIPSVIASKRSEHSNLSNNTQNQQITTNLTTSNFRNDVNVQLIVYDILGREVATLVNKEQSPGNYEVNFSAEEIPSGIYFYRLTAENKAEKFTAVKKMILIK